MTGSINPVTTMVADQVLPIVDWSVFALWFGAVFGVLVIWVGLAWMFIMPRVLRSGPLAPFAVRHGTRAPDQWSVDGSARYPLKRGTATGWGRIATLTLGQDGLAVGPSIPARSLIMPSFAFQWKDIQRIERRGSNSIRVVLSPAGAYLDFSPRNSSADEVLRRAEEHGVSIHHGDASL